MTTLVRFIKPFNFDLTFLHDKSDQVQPIRVFYAGLFFFAYVFGHASRAATGPEIVV